MFEERSSSSSLEPVAASRCCLMIMVIIKLHFGQTQFPSRLSSNAIDTGLLMTFDFLIPFLGEREGREEGRGRKDAGGS